MANVPQTCEILSERMQVPLRTLLHISRKLGEAGYLPRGPRGKNAPDLEWHHVAKIILACMAIADGIGATSVRVVQSLEKVLRLKGNAVFKAKRHEKVRDILVTPEGFFADALTFLLTKMAAVKRGEIGVGPTWDWSPDFMELGLDFQADAVYGWVTQRIWGQRAQEKYGFAYVDHPLPRLTNGLIRSSSVTDHLLWEVVNDILLTR